MRNLRLLLFVATTLGLFVSTETSGNEVNRVAPFWTNAKRMRKTYLTVTEGSKAKLICHADGGKPLQVDWYKNGNLITKSQRIGGYQFRRNKQILILRSVVVSDEGSYKCVVTNQFGSVTFTRQLQVDEPISFQPRVEFHEPINKTAHVGENVTFKFKIISKPRAHFQWLKQIKVNGSRIDPVTNTPYLKILKRSKLNNFGSDWQSYIVKNVTLADLGFYTCLAGNAIGISHSSAWLTVIEEPQSN